MFRWKKLGKVFDPTAQSDLPWMREYAQAPATLVFETFVRVYFSCRPYPDSKLQATSYIGFVDLDIKNIFNIIQISADPVLSLGNPGSFDEFGTMPFSPIKKNNEIWGYYGGWTRCESVPFNISIGLAKSRDDGLTFRKQGKGPFFTASLHEPFLIGVPRIRKFNDHFYLWYTAGKKWIDVNGRKEAIYKIHQASSQDGVDWQRNAEDIIPNVLGENEAQASADVFWLNQKYHMFFCYRYTSDFRENTQRSYRIGYAWSNDLILWHRDDNLAGIDVSHDGWDSEMISFPHITQIGNAYYLFYLGNTFGKYGFGVARMESLV